MEIKPIETVYNGYRFRSRLEARWAVFFDALEVDYQYEPEGYDLGEPGYYLPDFWLPQYRIWIEIKGEEPNDDEQEKCFYLADGLGFSVVLLSGPPDYKYLIPNEKEFPVAKYKTFTYHGWNEPNSELFHFDHWVFQSSFCLTENYPMLYEFLIKKGYNPSPPLKNPTPAQLRKQILEYIALDRKYWAEKHGGDHPKWKFGLNFSRMSICKKDGALYFDFWELGLNNTELLAIKKAKQARFEHSEIEKAVI